MLKPIATHHIAIFSSNFEQMEAFYTKTLGLPVTRRWDDAGIIFISVGSTTIELIRKEDDERSRAQRGGFDHLAIQVADLDEAYLTLTSVGIEFQSPPRDFKTVRIAFFTDPDGNLLELVEEDAGD